MLKYNSCDFHWQRMKWLMIDSTAIHRKRINHGKHPPIWAGCILGIGYAFLPRAGLVGPAVMHHRSRVWLSVCERSVEMTLKINWFENGSIIPRELLKLNPINVCFLKCFFCYLFQNVDSVWRLGSIFARGFVFLFSALFGVGFFPAIRHFYSSYSSLEK